MRQARDSAAGIAAVPAPQRPTPEQTRRVARLQERLRDIAARLGISAEVLATRRDVEALAFGAADDSPLLRGWRREVVGVPLRQLDIIDPPASP
jgi:ribonuclease D